MSGTGLEKLGRGEQNDTLKFLSGVKIIVLRLSRSSKGLYSTSQAQPHCDLQSAQGQQHCDLQTAASASASRLVASKHKEKGEMHAAEGKGNIANHSHAGSPARPTALSNDSLTPRFCFTRSLAFFWT